MSAANTYLPIRVTLRKRKEAIRVDETAEGMIHQSMEVVPGEGFVFGLFTSGVMTYGDNQKLPANTLVATGVTDATGSLTFSGLYPHGNYYIKELSVPAGWHLSTEQYPVKLTPENKVADENVIAVSLDEPILNRLIYTPVTITKRTLPALRRCPARWSRYTTKTERPSIANIPTRTGSCPIFLSSPVHIPSRRPMPRKGTR